LERSYMYIIQTQIIYVRKNIILERGLERYYNAWYNRIAFL